MPARQRFARPRIILLTCATLVVTGFLLATNDLADADDRRAERTAISAPRAPTAEALAPAAPADASTVASSMPADSMPASAVPADSTPADAQAMPAVHAAAHHTSDHIDEIASTVTWETVATRGGNWDDAGIWSTGAPPADGANVRIPAGRTVTIRDQEQTPIARVLAEGALAFAPDSDTLLVVDTLLVASTGRLSIGSAESPLAAGRTAKIVIQAHDNAPFDIDMKTRGILAAGAVETNGPSTASKARLTGDAMAGETRLTLADDLTGWDVGDQIDVTGTYYRAPQVSDDGTVDLAPLENEVRTITDVDGRTVTMDSALTYDHRRAADDLSIYVANLTRPISISSASPDQVNERGHVMFMAGAQVSIAGTGFYQLGRTQKDQAPSDTNPAGVYSLHFHRNGYQHRQTVTNSVIWGTPGWGLVNHSSYLDGTDNVVHDFVGSAYVSEAGDEMGSFVGNLASGGSNPPVGPKIASREVVSPQQKDRFRAGDLAKFGMGFWLVSPAVRVEDNVVAGGLGTAYFIFGLGIMEDGQFTGPPLDMFPAGTNPRTWAYPNQYTGAPMGLTADMAVASFRGNIAYGVFQGFRMRWTNDSAGFLLTRGASRIDDAVPDQIQGSSSDVQRTTSVLADLTFWNVASGMSIGYSDGYDIDNVTVINGPEYDPGCEGPARKMCTEHGIYLADGAGGQSAEVRNSHVVNVQDPIVLGNRSQQSTVNSFVDGRPFEARGGG